jgi:putative tricarboxylic transport membrane protein
MAAYRTGDIVSGAVLAGLGIFVVLEARRWEYVGPDGPGPGFFPLWYGMCMVALALLLMVTSFRRGGDGPEKPVDWREVGRALTAWTGLALCVGLLKVLGFLLAFGLFVFFLVYMMYRRTIVTALVTAISMSAAFYLLFPVALSVGLPVGKLGF